MTYVITRHCCNDAGCVDVCPVNCIHPAPAEQGYLEADMLYVDPDVCIDCGACADVCPVDAIMPDYDLTGPERVFIEVNARHFRQPEARKYERRRATRDFRSWSGAGPGALRVAIVGSGPAGCYAAEELLNQRDLNVEVDMFERLLVPWGLARFGVAPDHQKTKGVTRAFERTADRQRFSLYLGVEVGKDISPADLAFAYDAVIYAAGALSDRKLGIPGEELPGSHSAMEFAAWYNAHPDFVDRSFNLDTRCAVVVGNGNVALDVARVLTSDISDLRRTDIAEHALEALSKSRIREVFVLGRRGPAESSFTVPELIGLTHCRSLAVRVEPVGAPAEALKAYAEEAAHSPVRRKLELLDHLSHRPRTGGKNIVTLGFLRSPVAILGTSAVTGVRVVKNRLEPSGQGGRRAVATDQEEYIEAGLVLRSVGYSGSPIGDLPFNTARGSIPNKAGRVIEPATGETIKGAYVTGWIKRGPSGVIGTNKQCARETVRALLEDYEEGLLEGERQVSQVVSAILERPNGLQFWRAIDAHERMLGKASRRPRVKLVDRFEMKRIGSDGEDAIHD